MKCPKCKHDNLEEGILANNRNLAVKWCTECYGIWISSADYGNWQEYQRQWPSKSQPTGTLGVDFVQSPYDTKAALCPECSNYMSRAKVPFSRTPFYVERCMSCGGIWCDNGEWEMLENLGFHTQIDQMFSSAWQARAREQELAERERQAIVDKLGPELAGYVIELAEVLEDHPFGDFAAAYILRKFESKQKKERQPE